MPKLPPDKLNTVKGEQRRNQIRKVAARIFALKGYQGASLQEIADEAEVMKATLYHYYRSKEEILFDILSYMDEKIMKIMEEIRKRDLDLFDRFREQVAAHVRWRLNHPDIAKVAFRDWSELSGDRLQKQINRWRHYRGHLRSTIEECRESGLIPRSTNDALMLNFIIGALDAVNTWYDPKGTLTPERIGIVFGAMAEALLKELHHRVETGCEVPPFYLDVIERTAKSAKTGRSPSRERARKKPSP